MIQQPNLFEPDPVNIVLLNPDKFTEGFLIWLRSNTHIWEAFAEQAKLIRMRGYKRWGAKTIIEFLRHCSAIKENNSVWKINNDSTAYLARLFDLCYPNLAGLFEYREVKNTMVKKLQSQHT